MTMVERRTTKSWGIVDDRDVTVDGPVEHRVLWDDASRTSPSAWNTLVRRKTVRMPRPQLASPWGPSRTEPPPATSTALVRVQPPARPMAAPFEEPYARPLVLREGHELDPRVVMLAAPESSRAASFRVLRDNLLAKGLPRVLAVSSAAPREGKTTCALNLAVALAERRAATVLLVEGSFDAPVLAEIFGIDESTPTAPSLDFPWLAPFKLVELGPCLHVAAIVRARQGDAARPRFEKQGFDMVVDRLSRVGYNRVVIDAPTADASAAAGQLIGVADGVLLAVRAGHTTTRALRRAIERIGNGKTLGVALMDARD